MKTPLITSLSLALWVSLSFAQTKAPLKITVDKDQKTKQAVKQQGRATQSGNMIYFTPQVTAQNREMVMNIKLQKLGGTPLPGLVVKYNMFGRDKETRAIRSVSQGEKTIDLKPLETKTVQTESVDFESQDVNYNQGQFGGMNRSSGKEYYGLAVTVFVGEDKVASYFNPSTLDKLVEKLNEEPKDKSGK
jgi:hypothetical protein